MPSLLVSALVGLTGVGLTSFLAPKLKSSFTQKPTPLHHLSSTCPATSVPSCTNTTAVSNLCCFEAPGGLLLQTQYWVDIDGKDETFWEHEWKTHGTCYSTLKPKCLPTGSPKGAETLPTYTWLANQGITPSASATHTLSSLTAALKAESGFTPVLDCEGRTLDSISWYMHLKGSLNDGTFIQIDAPEKGTCPSSGIKYPPKSASESSTSSSKKYELTPRDEKSRRERRMRSDEGEKS
ncbi:ribonuclease T2-like protein [Mycena sp. CBHHK59/15]|nr:ribonuclease T2-like protein [Mycena sp. CBHHK59/15]